MTIELLKKTWKMLLLFLLRQNPFGEGTRAKMQFYGFNRMRMKRLWRINVKLVRLAKRFFIPFCLRLQRCPKSAAGFSGYKLLLRACFLRDEKKAIKGSLFFFSVISKIGISFYRSIEIWHFISKCYSVLTSFD